MKKIIYTLSLGILIASCAHKITPAAGGNSSNTGGVINKSAETPATTPSANNNTPTNTPVYAAPIPATSPEAAKALPPSASAGSKEMQGQSTFNVKCGTCHGLKVTTDYTVDRWISVMQVMALKAHLTEGEKENVLAYVKANAKKG
jgi:mono/diheme cytochrome c family protein